jgi:hypothetical protein
MATLDLSALAAMAPQADDLAARVTAGDVAACFDASIFLESVDRSTADARAFLAARRSVHVAGRDARNAAHLATDAADGLGYIIGFLTGTYELQAALDDARDAD